MKTNISLTDKVESLLEDKSNKFTNNKRSNLSKVFETLEKHGLLSKSEYTLPMKDTIGRTYFDKVQFKEE